MVRNKIEEGGGQKKKQRYRFCKKKSDKFDPIVNF